MNAERTQDHLPSKDRTPLCVSPTLEHRARDFWQRGACLNEEIYAALGEIPSLECTIRSHEREIERLTRERDEWRAVAQMNRPERITAERDRLREALEFYAARESWAGDIADDRGAIASEALSGASPSADETEDDRLEHAKVILDEVLAERGRQVYRLGWSPEHDDEHDEAELASAAACYALNAACLSHPMNGTSMDAETAKAHGWPWAEPHWKPKDARRDLIRAGALIIAELERLDRSAEKASSRRLAQLSCGHQWTAPGPTDFDIGAAVHCGKCGGAVATIVAAL